MRKLCLIVLLILVISVPSTASAIESNNSQYLGEVINNIVNDTGSALGVDTTGLNGIINKAFDIDINEGIDERLLQEMLDYAVDMSQVLNEQASNLMDKMITSLASNHGVIIDESDSDSDILCKVIEKLSEEYSDIDDYSMEDIMQIALDEAKNVIGEGTETNIMGSGLTLDSVFSIVQNTFSSVLGIFGTDLFGILSMFG